MVEWSDIWQIGFNGSKCKVLHIGKNNPCYEYTFCAYYFRLLVYFHLSFVVASFLRNIFSQISVNREIKIHAKQYHIADVLL